MSDDARPRFSDLRISASAIRDLEMCPRRWSFRYRQGLAPEDITGDQVLGRGMHEALAEHYGQLRTGGGTPTAAQMLDIVAAAIDRHLEEPLPILFDEDEDREHLIAEAGRLLAAFASTPLTLKDVLLVEQPFEIEAVDPTGRQHFEERVVGIIDLVGIDRDNRLVVVDHKIRRRRPSMTQADAQLPIYHQAALQLVPGGGPPRLVYQELLRHKLPSVETRNLLLAEREIEEGWEVLLGSLTLIAAAVVHPQPDRLLPRRRGWQCTRCGYRTRCLAR